jgi:hypothetical protein
VTDRFGFVEAGSRESTIDTYHVLRERLSPTSAKRLPVTFTTKAGITEKRIISSPALLTWPHLLRVFSRASTTE